MQSAEKSNEPVRVTVKRVINASRSRIFDAWTKPEMMNKWFTGGPGRAETSVDLRVGGNYTNEMFITGETTCEGKTADELDGVKSYMHTGEYLEIVPPERLVFTWNSPSVQNTKVTVLLKEVAGGTEVSIIHELPQEQSDGHQKGWTFALEGLDRYLS